MVVVDGRECTVCQSFKAWEEFNKNPTGRNGYYSQCKACVSDIAKKKYRTTDKYHYLQRTYGIDKEQFFAMYHRQQGNCLICCDPISLSGNNGRRQAVVDHCHTTGKVRGILCNHCNRGLGMFKEDTRIITRALEYIKINENKSHN